MEQAFFSGWSVLIRTVVVGVLAYISLVFFLRVTGKRTLSKMNAFDLIVTVALGSILATILINQNVTLAQGALALALLIGLQFIITATSVRVRWMRQLVTGEPSMVFWKGEFIDDALKRERVTRDEVLAAVRSQGISALNEIEAVVLETDGSFSVVRPGDQTAPSSLAGVENANHRQPGKAGHSN